MYTCAESTTRQWQPCPHKMRSHYTWFPSVASTAESHTFSPPRAGTKSFLLEIKALQHKFLSFFRFKGPTWPTTYDCSPTHTFSKFRWLGRTALLANPVTMWMSSELRGRAWAQCFSLAPTNGTGTTLQWSGPRGPSEVAGNPPRASLRKGANHAPFSSSQIPQNQPCWFCSSQQVTRSSKTQTNDNP